MDDRSVVIGAVLLICILSLAILAPYIAPADPLKINPRQKLHSPGWQYPMGTDHLGRCIFSRLLYGARVSIGIALIVMGGTMGISITVGTLAGYLGGKIDDVISIVINIVLAFPSLILALAIIGMLGPSLLNLLVSMAAVGWAPYARITRGIVFTLKEREFIIAIQAAGGSNGRIIVRHILPNMLSPIIVLSSLDMGKIILSISGLSFLGLGAQPPTPEWGVMLSDGRPFMQIAPHVMLFPGLAIALTVMAFNLLGDGLRDALDPKIVRT
jgi:peptide/nickel transport system permease protein